MNFSKRAYILIAGVLLVILVGVLAFFVSRNQQDTLASNTEMAAVRRGTLVATVNATGAVSPVREADLGFNTTGSITQISVKQGGRVQTGQLLAKLDTRALDLQLTQAEANLTAAQAKLDQLKNPAPADVAAAQSAVTSAEAALAQLKTPTQNDLIIAKASVDKAKAALDRAQADYDRVGGATNPMIGMLPQSVALQQATTDYQSALAAYNRQVNPTSSQLTQAQAAVDQAHATLSKLTNPSPSDLQSAQANVDQVRAARDLAKTRVDDAILKAPFDGIVTEVDYDVGSYAPVGKTVMSVADTLELRVKLNIDETDIARVQVGQDATVDLDAYPDATIPARVTDIAASATTTQGVVNYIVTITLGQSPVLVKIGMTANANIVVAKKDDALLLPNGAIRASNSKRFVTIQKPDGHTEEVEVKLGLANDQMTEVVSGLNEGDQVLISSTQTLPSFSPFGGQSK